MRPLPQIRLSFRTTKQFLLTVLAVSTLSGQVQAQQFGQQFILQFEQFRQFVIEQVSDQFLQPTRAQVLEPITVRSQQFGPQFGQPQEFRNGAQVSFQQQLETGLYARRAEEFAFIDRVVTMVDQNQLSRELVTSTYLWAQKRDGQRRAATATAKRPYPFVYFEQGLKTRAARLGITVQ